MHPLLQIKNLSVDFISDFGITTAVKDISFELNKGEILAVVGESGSGKTVTSLSILQLLATPPAVYKNGEILFSEDGTSQTDLLKLSGKKLRAVRGNKISMIFQEPMTSLNPVTSCGSQVVEAIQLHRKMGRSEAKQQAIELFRQVDLPDPENIFNRYPHQLSGGQKQRIMIAMATSCNPHLLIADEPTTALDVIVQKTILQLIKKLQAQYGMGLIYITHDLGLVAEIADKVIVMYKGAVVEAGSVKKIFNTPEHPYTKALLACSPSQYVKGERLSVIGDFIHEGKLALNSEALVTNNPSRFNSTAQPLKQPEILLQVKNLKVYFPAKKKLIGKALQESKAVNDVSFNVNKGETVGLVGESGCGKTTLGRTLIRLIEPTSGSIFFEGRDIANIPGGEMRKMRKKIQIIFQDPYGSLNPRMTIGSAILEPLKVHDLFVNFRQRKEKVMDLLNKVDLKAEHYNRYPHEFSGGQRQRICIARALGLNPDFLICDESVSALDVSVQAQVLNLLSDLKKDFGFTSIFISHDFGVVRYVSDRIIVMNKGCIEEIGSAEEIYLRPQKEYTKKLISAIPKGFIFG